MCHRIFAVLTALALATLALAEPPRVFHDEGYKSARAASDERGTMLVVDFTASWCGPCKQMDRDTWTNSRVEEWLRENTVSVQVDVDEQPKIAEKYNVSAMPTVVVVKDGEPFDRKVGYQGPDQLVAWLTGVKEGKSTAEVLRESIEHDELSERQLISKRSELANLLVDSGAYEEATRHYVWLWRKMFEPDAFEKGINGSFIMAGLQRLIDKHPPARERFEVIREEARKGVDARRNLRVLREWVSIMDILGHDDELLAWYDAHKDIQRDRKAVEQFTTMASSLFLEHGRWKDFGVTLDDTFTLIHIRTRHLDLPQDVEMTDEQRDFFEQSGYDTSVPLVQQYHTALLAADREAEAFRVANILFEKLEGERLARAEADLARHAMENGHPHEKHVAWLEKSGDEALAGEVRASLNERE